MKFTDPKNGTQSTLNQLFIKPGENFAMALKLKVRKLFVVVVVVLTT